MFLQWKNHLPLSALMSYNVQSKYFISLRNTNILIEDPIGTQYSETANRKIWYVRPKSPLLSPSISTQTPATLNSGSPRKLKLSRKSKSLRRAKKRAPLKKRKFCLGDSDKFLNMPLVDNVKA